MKMKIKMNKTVLSATIISALAATSFTALADGPNFYGRADLAITNSDMGIATQNQKSGTIIENNFSWLGVKGTEKINDGLEVVYQMEFGVSNFDNSGDTFAARNTFIGLKSAAAGTILVGRNDTVFKAAEGGFDLFGNTNSDIDLLAAGQTRSADGFTYYSPKIADLVTLNATYLMDDNYDQLDTDGEEKYTDNMYALSATIGDKALKAQNYYVSAAYNDSIENVTAYRGVAQVKLGNVILGGFYQNSEHVDSKYDNLEGDTYFVNAAYVMGNLKLKAMYGADDSGLGKYVSRYVGGNDGSLETVSNVDIQQFSVGADYRLSKNMLVYGHYTKYDGDMMLSSVKQDLSDDIVTVGVRLDF